jgi:O-antigen biosynthesis protein
MIRFPSFRRPRVSVLVVTYGGWAWTERALDALRSNTELPYEVVIVDNASPDETPDRLREHVRGAEVILNERNEGFGPANNAAAERARGELLVLLNPDALVRPGWLEPLIETLERDPRIGAVVPRLLDPGGTVQEVGSIVWADGSTWAVGAGAGAEDPVHRFRRSVDYGSAACFLIGRETFRRVGGFHPAYRPAYCEDVDLALALRAAGLRVEVDPRSEVVHVRFGTVGRNAAARLIRRNRRVLVRRWGAALAEHPRPYRPERPHRLWAGRDREAVERILVVGERPDQTLLAALGRAYGRVTMLCQRAPGASPELDRLLDAGIEVAAARDAGPWLRDRRFHYSAVVFLGARPGIREALADSQPQAEVLEEEVPPRPERVLAALEAADIPAEPAGGAKAVR